MAADDLQDLARRHLWGHFSSLSSRADIPIIERGEGCYVWDRDGKRYLDGLSGLFTVQVGHGRQELAQAAARQAERLAYFPIWSYGNEPAIELAARLAQLAPGDLTRSFFTGGGSEAVESAWKLARQYFRRVGQPATHEGPQPLLRLPRHDLRGAVDHRRALRSASRSNRSSPAP